MKRPKKQGDSTNLRLVSELAGKSAPSASSAPELADGIPARLVALQGELTVSAFARKCGIRDSLMRKYLLGSTPGADKLAKIAEKNDVSADWLATGKGRGPHKGLGLGLDALLAGGKALPQHLAEPFSEYHGEKSTPLLREVVIALDRAIKDRQLQVGIELRADAIVMAYDMCLFTRQPVEAVIALVLPRFEAASKPPE